MRHEADARGGSRLPAAADSSERCARPGWLWGARSRKTPMKRLGCGRALQRGAAWLAAARATCSAASCERPRQTELFLGVHWLGCYPRSLVFAPLSLDSKVCLRRAEHLSAPHGGLAPFLLGRTITLALSRETTLRLWTPLAGSKPRSRSFLSMMADHKALWHSGNASRGQRILRKGCGSGGIVCVVATLS